MYCSLSKCYRNTVKKWVLDEMNCSPIPWYCIKKAVEVIFTLSHCNKVLCNLCKVDILYMFFYKVDGRARGALVKSKWNIWICDCSSICFLIKNQVLLWFAVVEFNQTPPRTTNQHLKITSTLNSSVPLGTRHFILIFIIIIIIVYFADIIFNLNQLSSSSTVMVVFKS